ncbi:MULTISPECIES: contact-dependent growth inhibition system immunity protein [Tenacibaculum]|uniref:contact-dependent growth inhibition system immunity protein n=1 Tax=Tenacibaculum TaxID=104267 RepID=UPI000EB2FC78|nr:contact-dependent growth inhibition system immunity protein [Tenacibaculum discolor]RLJ99611.1 uncharacterized protein DUF1436 [Tenacibaculum discolor]
MKDIKSANILKFKEGKVLTYPLRTIKDGGSFPVPPFIIDNNLSSKDLAERLKEVLELSSLGLEPPRDKELLFHKDNISITGIKNVKEYHKNSFNVGVYTKEGNYYISPSNNLGSRKGFRYDIEKQIVLPLNSSIEELALALEQAFSECS